MPLSEILAEISAERGWEPSDLLSALLVILDKGEETGSIDEALSQEIIHGIDALQDR